MKFDKLPHQFIIFLIAFWVSFILGLILYKNRLHAFYAGLISVPTIALSTWGTSAYRHYQNIIIYDELAQEIEYLEEQGEAMYDSLYAANVFRQNMETRIKNLDEEKAYLLDSISKLNLERRKLNDEINSLNIKGKHHKDTYSSKNEEVAYLESQYEELSFKLELLEITIEKKQNKLNEIDNYLKEFEESQQVLVNQKNQLTQQVRELDNYYNQLSQNINTIETQRQNLENSFINEKKEIDDFKNIIEKQTKQQKVYNQIVRSLEERKEELESNIETLEAKSKELKEIVDQATQEIQNSQKPHVKFKFFPPEWQEWIEFCEKLTYLDKEVFKAILREDSELIKKIADEQATMPQVLIENLNQQALNLMKDTPFINNENSLVPRIHDEYLSIFQELLVIKFLDTLP